MFVTFDDEVTREYEEVAIVPGVGIAVRNTEGVETVYPWHRIAKLEREVPIASPLVVPKPNVEPLMGFL